MSEMRKRARQCLLTTWDAIGGDVLTALEEAGQSAEMPRDHVIEVTLDADHYVAHGRDPEAAEFIKALDYRGKIQLGMEAFEHEVYGW